VEKNDRKKAKTLSVANEDNVSIYLGSLNKDDRKDVVNIVNEAAGQKPDE
jgi:hypothetical protein